MRLRTQVVRMEFLIFNQTPGLHKSCCFLPSDYVKMLDAIFDSALRIHLCHFLCFDVRWLFVIFYVENWFSTFQITDWKEGKINSCDRKLQKRPRFFYNGVVHLGRIYKIQPNDVINFVCFRSYVQKKI